MSLAQEGSSDKRRELLRAVTDLFMASDGVTSEQSQLFDDVMTRVADQAGADGRRELSARIAPVDHAPRGIVNKLARDEDIEVASPVLRDSNVLNDEDLVQIAEVKGQDHMVAMSERKQISSIVTDVLIRRGNSLVMRSVSGNAGAQLSETGAQTLSQKALEDSVIQNNLYKRSDLPKDVAEEVKARGEAIARHEAARIIPTVIADFMELSGLSADRIKMLMFEDRPDMLVIICKSVNLDAESFRKVVDYRADHTGEGADVAAALIEQYDILPPEAAQRMARFLKVRRAAGG